MANTIYCVAVALMLAAAVLQADQWPSSREGPSDGEPMNDMSLLQTKLQMNTVIPMLGLEVNSVAATDALKDPHAMLATLENMVRSGDTPAFDLMAVIKSIIQDDVLPGLQSTHVASALDTISHLNAFHACNNQTKTRQAEIENSTKKTLDSSRSLHAICRDVEKALHGHNLTDPDSYCNKLGDFLHNVDDLRIPKGSGRAEGVDYVKSASNTNMCDGSEVCELDDLCTAKEDELSNKTAECLTKQVFFECQFCNWKSEVEAICEINLNSCHSVARAAYNDHVSKTRPLVEKWNTETAALHKILCYSNTWLGDKHEGDNNRSHHNASHFEHCNNQTHVPDERDYGTPPEKVACPLVDNYPGTQGFIDQEYSGFIDFVETVVPCTGSTTCTESTAAPTEAPCSGDFALGETGMVDGCPLGYVGILELSICEEAAASSLGFGILRTTATNSDSTLYPGCYFNHNSAYFNTHPNPDGSEHTEHTGQVCMCEAK